MRQLAEFIAVLSCSLFAGAALYISLVEHPARMECGAEIATTAKSAKHLSGALRIAVVHSVMTVVRPILGCGATLMLPAETPQESYNSQN